MKLLLQQNELTGWLDISHVYGINEREAEEIKTGGGNPIAFKGHIQFAKPFQRSKFGFQNKCAAEGCWFLGTGSSTYFNYFLIDSS